MVAGIAAFGEVSSKQSFLQFLLVTAAFGPVQQTVCIESVVDARPLAHVETETPRGAPGAERFAVPLELVGRGAVLPGDVLDDILALRAHLRIELERLEV